MLYSTAGVKNRVGKPNGRWIEAVDDREKTQGIRNWKREALGKFEWQYAGGRSRYWAVAPQKNEQTATYVVLGWS
jgi:hypothetical protein